MTALFTTNMVYKRQLQVSGSFEDLRYSQKPVKPVKVNKYFE